MKGHSNWGRFTLRGRVRMGDGLVTFDKEYVSVFSSSIAVAEFRS
jgi:hypothetical protein